MQLKEVVLYTYLCGEERRSQYFGFNRGDGNFAVISHSRYLQISDVWKERSKAFLFDDPVA